MFSEYASKFLAQSQSRISFASTQDNPGKQARPDAQLHQARSRYFGSNRGLRQQGGGLAPFGFGSKISQHAPLFQSIANDAVATEDEEEHEREVADYFALQRSRKHFVQGRLEDSSEAEDYHEDLYDRHALHTGRQRRHPTDNGIESSWHGDENGENGRRSQHDSQQHESESLRNDQQEDMTDTLKSIDLTTDEIPVEINDSMAKNSRIPILHQGPDSGAHWSESAPSSSNVPSIAGSGLSTKLRQQSGKIQGATILHDQAWGKVYVATLILFFASFVIVWLHVSVPSPRTHLGDTIYSAIQHSQGVLVVDTFVGIVISIAWLAILRTYTRPLIYCLLVILPITLTTFSLYPFVSTFQRPSDAPQTFQDKCVRFLSLVPLIIGGFWIYGVLRSRQAFGRAIDLLELSVKILTANPPLILFGFITLATTVVWSWLWIAIITRVFLGGHFTSNMTFMINASTWWLGAFYIIVYLWTLNVLAGIQRATTAATVSQWYFHRRNIPAVPSSAVARAALSHSLTICFGTICLSTLLALLVRIPALLLPRRFLACLGIISTTLIPDSLIVVTDPLTLTHAAVHNQSLADATRAVERFSVSNRIGRLGGQANGSLRLSRTRPHRLALFLLYATRIAASFAFGFGAWVHAAHFRSFSNDVGKYTGSIYAYFVGLIAGGIGWAITSAMESVLTGIVDATVVCWESETSSGSSVRYCREAEWILGDGGEAG